LTYLQNVINFALRCRLPRSDAHLLNKLRFSLVVS
jgi:hypothetical protein